MTATYEIGQTGITTNDGLAVEIYDIVEFGTSIFYDCVVTGRGRLMIHSTNLTTTYGF